MLDRWILMELAKDLTKPPTSEVDELIFSRLRLYKRK